MRAHRSRRTCVHLVLLEIYRRPRSQPIPALSPARNYRVSGYNGNAANLAPAATSGPGSERDQKCTKGSVDRSSISGALPLSAPKGGKGQYPGSQICHIALSRGELSGSHRNG
jgi:hypothetical protein